MPTTPDSTMPATVTPPKPKKEIILVQRVDLRNRVWTGFLYGVGIWAGAIVGIAVMTMIATVITTVLGVGLAGVASGMQP